MWVSLIYSIGKNKFLIINYFISLFVLKNISLDLERRQDGRVEGPWAHLLPQEHQNQN